jgi:hypothetical protein
MAELTLTVSAGLTLRGQVRRELKRSAWAAGLTIDIDEDKGLLESVMRVRVAGPDDVVVAYQAAVERWGRRLGAMA